MSVQHTYIRFLVGVFLIFCFFVGCLVNWAPSSNEECNCQNKNDEKMTGTNSHWRDAGLTQTEAVNDSTPRLAIIVPFRDRFEELLQFAPHMRHFLNAQGIPHDIFVLNQVDRYRFNRASLINVGFLFTERRGYNYIGMHDVDLLPLNPSLKYSYPKHGPLHIAAPELHPKYHYATFVGGILLVAREHFRLMNGMSNKYWGWGLEDDEFYVRIMDAGLKVHRPENIKTGINDTFLHIHDRAHRRRDMVKCYNQREETRRRDRETGLDTLRYTIAAVHNLTIDGVPLTVVDVELECDRTRTPWCDCEGAPKPTNSQNAQSAANVKKKPKS